MKKLFFILVLLASSSAFANQDTLTSAVWHFKRVSSDTSSQAELLLYQETNAAFQRSTSSNPKSEPIVGVRFWTGKNPAEHFIILLKMHQDGASTFDREYFYVLSESDHGLTYHLAKAKYDPATKDPAKDDANVMEVATLSAFEFKQVATK